MQTSQTEIQTQPDDERAKKKEAQTEISCKQTDIMHAFPLNVSLLL